MNDYTTSRMFFNRVNSAKNSDFEKQTKTHRYWAERATQNMENGRYDIGYEYTAMIELLCVKLMDKSDSFRLKMWRMFVKDFRRAYSDYEFMNFQKLFK